MMFGIQDGTNGPCDSFKRVKRTSRFTMSTVRTESATTRPETLPRKNVIDVFAQRISQLY